MVRLYRTSSIYTFKREARCAGCFCTSSVLLKVTAQVLRMANCCPEASPSLRLFSSLTETPRKLRGEEAEKAKMRLVVQQTRLCLQGTKVEQPTTYYPSRLIGFPSLTLRRLLSQYATSVLVPVALLLGGGAGDRKCMRRVRSP